MSAIKQPLFLLALLTIAVGAAACAEKSPHRKKGVWDSSGYYDDTHAHYEDNDSYYTAPEGYGFCGGVTLMNCE